MWESDLHTSTVHRQNKSLELQGKLDGIELALKVSCTWFIFLDACLFGSFIVKQCRVEETITFLCCRFDFLRRLNSKTGKLVDISRYALNCWKTHNNVQSNRKNCCSACQVVLIAASLLKLEEPTRIFWNFPPTCGFGGEGIGHKTASECIRALVML